MDDPTSSTTARLVPLREHIEALFDRDRSALEVASQEREKSAQALSAERDKTAAALATALERQIDQGDRELREHIAQQIAQIRAALISADLLELERIAALRATVLAGDTLSKQHLEAARREVELMSAASNAAIAKAETATEKRFESVNEFRAQLSDMIARFIPREVADAQLNELRLAVAALTTRMDRMAGSNEGHSQAKAGMTTATQIAIAGLGLLVAVLSIVVVVILANT